MILTSTLIAEITPSVVYTEALKIEKEINILKKYFKITQKAKYDKESIDVKPRHVWQIGYMNLVNINILREKHDLPRVTPGVMSPVLEMKPSLVYEQMIRVLGELKIFKKQLNIKQTSTPTKSVKGKIPLDVFNKNLSIASELELLTKTKITPSDVYSELKRLYHDISYILDYLHINDDTIPDDKKLDTTLKHNHNMLKNLLKEIGRIQNMAGIKQTNFMGMHNKEAATPKDTFIIAQMAIAELQTIKAYLRLKDFMTPSGGFEEGKMPPDVYQIVVWCAERLKLIKSLHRGN
jgi:hypothetical protein